MRGTHQPAIAAGILAILVAPAWAGPPNRANPGEAGEPEEVRAAGGFRGDSHQSYAGKWFSLSTTADRYSARRIVAGLEQAFLAYVQILPPRLKPNRPLRVLAYGTRDEYRAHLQRLSLRIENPAVFVERENLVICGSDVAQYSAQLAQVAEMHHQLRSDLSQIKERLPARLAELGRQLQAQGKTRGEIAALIGREKRTAEQEVKLKQAQIARCQRDNDRLFDKVAGAMLQRLYHEGFHAYLANYVYPSPKYQVPLWLNEGLASAFETAAVDGSATGFARLQRPALRRLRTDVRSGRPLSLAHLLTTGPQDYVSAIERTADDTRRHYDYAWGLAYYLTFELKLLGSPEMERYLLAAQDPSPRERFQRLVGQPLEGFERRWHGWLSLPPEDP